MKVRISILTIGIGVTLALQPDVLTAKGGFNLPPQLAVGAAAPDFALLNTVDGSTVKLADYKGKAKAVCIVWFCNHCPVAKAYEERIIALGREFRDKGVQFILISSNDTAGYPDDSPSEMKKRAADKGYPFPYLFDGTQEVALAYGARVTPHIFLLDGELALRYRGAVDGNQFDPSAVKEHYLRDALATLVSGGATEIKVAETTAVGCTIKYFGESGQVNRKKAQ